MKASRRHFCFLEYRNKDHERDFKKVALLLFIACCSVLELVIAMYDIINEKTD